MRLFEPVTLGRLQLANAIVMAPLTRSRAIDNIPGEAQARYYAARASAGLIITEGTSPSPNGLGYARIPGIFSQAQVAGWRRVTDAVHQAGGRIFMQMMHTGRVGHSSNLPEGAQVLAPSAVELPGEVWSDSERMQPYTPAQAMTLEQVAATREEYIQGARNAIEAGFDGVEIHAANGYLLEQFIHPHTNRRQDEYGGSMEARCRFVLEVAQGMADAIGADRVGIRISPYGVFNDMPLVAEHHAEVDETYGYLASQLSEIGLVYLHLVDHSSMGAPEVPESLKRELQQRFSGKLIRSGGFDVVSAEETLQQGLADVIAFGRPFIANPDLVRRMRDGLPLAEADPATFYSPGEPGYNSYPAYSD